MAAGTKRRERANTRLVMIFCFVRRYDDKASETRGMQIMYLEEISQKCGTLILTMPDRNLESG